MHKFLISALILVMGSTSALAQKQLVWEVLGMTTYEMMEQDGMMNYIPNFPSVLVDQFEGQEVVIAGYLIPIDIEAQKYALSKNPFTSCFFCGGAGPETVMELRFAEPPGRFATDEYLMIKGTLVLQRDGSGLFFILRNAEIHG